MLVIESADSGFSEKFEDPVVGSAPFVFWMGNFGAFVKVCVAVSDTSTLGK